MESFLFLMMIFGGVIVAAQLVLQVLGVIDYGASDSFDMHAEAGDSDSSFKLLSIQALGSFCLMFGGVGYSILQDGQNQWLALGAASVVGVFSVWIFRKLMSILLKAGDPGAVIDLEDLVGEMGIISVPITHSSGQVQLDRDGGSERVATNPTWNVPMNTRVKVTEIQGHTLVVEPIIEI